ncbi:Factor arrest protein 11 [Sorochytrium milnesiophthora]
MDSAAPAPPPQLKSARHDLAMDAPADDVDAAPEAAADNDDASSVASSTDTSADTSADESSLSLTQIKAIVSETTRKQKATLMNWTYDDADSLENELNEYYNHSEMAVFEECRRLFQGHYPKKWTKSSRTRRRDFITLLLENMEIKAAEKRIESLMKLLYIAQGVFGEHATKEDHIAAMYFNNYLIRRSNGLQVVYQALRGACSTVDRLVRAVASSSSGIGSPSSATIGSPQAPATKASGTGSNGRSKPPRIRASAEDVHTRSPRSVSSTRNSDTALDNSADTSTASLSSTPEVTGLRLQQALEMANKEAAMLLNLLYVCVEVAWRATEQSPEDRTQLKAELEALNPPIIPYVMQLLPTLSDGRHKHFPIKKLVLMLWKLMLVMLGGKQELKELRDIARRKEGLGLGEPLADKGKGALLFTRTMTATPYDYVAFYNETTRKYPSVTLPAPSATYTGAAASFSRRRRMFSSRRKLAPSSDEPKLLPDVPDDPMADSRSMQRDASPLVPAPIRESLRVYNKWLYISLPSVQVQKEVDMMEKSRKNETSQSAAARDTHQDDDDQRLRDPYASDNLTFGALVSPTESLSGGRITREENEQLNKSEHIYRAILPNITPIVVSLLKLLLAGAPVPKSYTTNSSHSGAVDVADDPSSPDPAAVGSPDTARSDTSTGAGSRTLEQIAISTLDRNRHREILTKGLSGILILFMKHLNCFHTLMFEHLSQIMVDSNCILLLLKTLNFHDHLKFLTTRNEIDDMNFFTYFNPAPDSAASPAPYHIRAHSDQGAQLEPSWRNAFLTHNLVHVLHKLIKHKSGRILAMVQHKSSAILKRVLKCNCAAINLWTLKLLRSIIPFAGKKWRHTNMKVITAIYQTLRPDLRNDYLVSSDADAENEEAQTQETQLRELVAHYHQRRYPEVFAAPVAPPPEPTNEGDDELLQLIRDLSGPGDVSGQWSSFVGDRSDDELGVDNAYMLPALTGAMDDIVLDEDFLSGGYEAWLRSEVFGEDYDVYADGSVMSMMMHGDMLADDDGAERYSNDPAYGDGEDDDDDDDDDDHVYPDIDEVNGEEAQYPINQWKDEVEEQY